MGNKNKDKKAKEPKDSNLTVRHDSVFAFINSRMMYPHRVENIGIRDNNPGPAYLLQKEIHIRKDAGISEGEIIDFIIEEKGHITGSEHQATMQYIAREYDDVSLKLEHIHSLKG